MTGLWREDTQCTVNTNVDTDGTNSLGLMRNVAPAMTREQAGENAEEQTTNQEKVSDGTEKHKQTKLRTTETNSKQKIQKESKNKDCKM